MSATKTAGSGRLKKESILLGVLLSCGLVLLPVAVFMVGKRTFGDYGDGGLLDFCAALYARLLSADPAAFLLVLSPYLIWQILRLSVAALRWRPPSA